MSKYRVSRGVEADLDEIWEFIATDNIAAADRLTSQLRQAFESIARAPGIGHSRKDLTTYPVLFFPVASYLVIYRLGKKYVEIVAVTQGARDIPRFLRQRVEN